MDKPLILKQKICLLGDGAVGKTSLIRRFVEDAFRDDYLLTIGTKTSKKRIIIKKPDFPRDIHLTLIIWDIMGQISFRKLLHPTYLRGARGAIFVCDLTRLETLEHLDDWIDSLYVEGKVMPSVFVGNKSDLVDKHAFGKAEIESVASAYDSPSFTASAKTGENVENLFSALAEKIISDMAARDVLFVD
ncbi:MAG: GTP-binding protein [Methanomassiliicoccales archaeon]|nr:MAG: GTP-binding protein [Methanomassiliicoccales archaeon]